MPFIANKDSLTFHIRITKKCNADCSYCSSYENTPSTLMSLQDLDKSLSFIKNFILKNKMGGNREMITVQYVGGELSTIPIEYLTNFSNIVKNHLSPLFKEFRHGGQTNLIASKSTLNSLIDIFDGNLGTSVDNFTNQRTVKKSSEKYKTIFLKNIDYTKKITGKVFPSILVLDKKMEPYIKQEIDIANSKKMNLTLRPVFNGGMPIENIPLNHLVEIYKEIFSNWFLKQHIIIEPHYSFLKKRMLKFEKNNEKLATISGCPFQNNCASSSLNLEPNGDLFVCLDMADSKNLVFGNAIEEKINDEIFSKLMERQNKLNTDCYSCDYYNDCQGGCMNEAIEHTGDLYGKTFYCNIWKELFKLVDEKISSNKIEDIKNWITKIEK
jgi:radical SAM protein with 4Fe4S-binding SPASM domain